MLKLRDIVRSAHVVRWSSVKHRRPQYLAEHHYLVTIIAKALAKNILSKTYYTAEQQILLVDYCLNHDLPEICTGDLSSVSKRKLESLLEDKKGIFKQLDYEILPALKGLDDRMKGTPLTHIAKLADWCDAIIYLQQEGADNAEIKTTKKILEGFCNFLPDNTGENISKKLDEFFEQPISHSHGIELKLKEAYSQRVKRAQAEFPDFDWSKAFDVLAELESGDNATLAFEY